jgi:acetyl esterase/lipase
MAVSRWWLHVQAIVWRLLMKIGMVLHGFPFPSPPLPSFSRKVHPTTSSDGRGPFSLRFYTPKGYEKAKAGGRRYPVVVNFHGGGFCLGSATDDTRWARSVTEEVDAVLVSVDYHLAPEYPFPAAVDDGVETLIYLSANAEDLGIDPSKVSLTGFSAGGNLAFTVALRAQYYTPSNISTITTGSGSSDDINTPLQSHHAKQSVAHLSNLTILSIFSWYPILDFVMPRDHRRAQCEFPEKTLPAFFTDLFDESYLPSSPHSPAHTTAARSSPYASPGLAPDSMLADALPHDIFLYMCEWDMLLSEGQGFVRRLEGLGKRVRSMMIERAPHAWDKSPNPFRDQESIDVFYKQACAEMKFVFDHERVFSVRTL